MKRNYLFTRGAPADPPACAMTPALEAINRTNATQARLGNDCQSFTILAEDWHALREELLKLYSEIDDIAEQRDSAEIDKMRADAERDALARWIVARNARPQNGDWACAQCKPDSDMLKEGFVCTYHRAEAIAQRSAVLIGEAP